MKGYGAAPRLSRPLAGIDLSSLNKLTNFNFVIEKKQLFFSFTFLSSLPHVSFFFFLKNIEAVCYIYFQIINSDMNEDDVFLEHTIGNY